MGAWIEIYYLTHSVWLYNRRTPRWVRGLKYIYLSFLYNPLNSRTPRWVRGLKSSAVAVAPVMSESHPTMGAWIEILNIAVCIINIIVAPHDGCVDWNNCYLYHDLTPPFVAPHDGCVDWNNNTFWRYGNCITVAPHDGCVDWNYNFITIIRISCCRTPRWVRGLKFRLLFCYEWMF